MEHYAGIDVSLERSSVCVVDATGGIVREAKVPSEPETLVAFFRQLGPPLTRIGLEAGPLSQWLHAGLTRAGFEVVLLETRQVKAALSAMVVKTDRKTPAASPSCCAWAGSGPCTASRYRRRRPGRSWPGASSCRASSLTLSSASAASCAASVSRSAR